MRIKQKLQMREKRRKKYTLMHGVDIMPLYSSVQYYRLSLEITEIHQ
jgi:hypothetical protein